MKKTIFSNGYDAVNLFDPKIGMVDLSKKEAGEGYDARFVTSCKATPREQEHFIKSGGNFVTEPVLRKLEENLNSNKNNNNL